MDTPTPSEETQAPTQITGTINITLSDSDLLDIARHLGIDVDKIIEENP